MKPLQNNFTTPEQSKRLLELGVPADSADCFYDLDANNPPHANNIPWYLDIPYSELIREFNLRDFLPCWSVGRLIEIWDICGNTCECVTAKRDETRTELLVKLYEENATCADFSKLEEKK